MSDSIILKFYNQAVAGIQNDWLSKPSLKFYNHIISQPDVPRITFLVINLDFQVVNGGFHQYFLNTFGQFSSEAIEALHLIGATVKAELLKKALNAVSVNYTDYEEFRKDIIKSEVSELIESEELDEYLGKLTDEYYADEENIDPLLESFILKRFTE